MNASRLSRAGACVLTALACTVAAAGPVAADTPTPPYRMVRVTDSALAAQVAAAEMSDPSKGACFTVRRSTWKPAWLLVSLRKGVTYDQCPLEMYWSSVYQRTTSGLKLYTRVFGDGDDCSGDLFNGALRGTRLPYRAYMDILSARVSRDCAALFEFAWTQELIHPERHPDRAPRN